ncbi:sorting nexin-21 isoform X2 [Bacillus rossius redtenbacheri]
MDEPEAEPVAVAPTLKIEVVHARTVDQENEKKHVAYTVMLRKDGATPDPHPAVIERRYSDFLELYESLRRDHAGLMAGVAFPKKVLLGNFEPGLISERSAGFEGLLCRAAAQDRLRNSRGLSRFLQRRELEEARAWLEARRYDQAVPLLENTFRLLNKLHTDRHPEVMVALCRLVACCSEDPLAARAEGFAELALRRYDAVSDVDLLRFYVPLLQLCARLWWRLGKDKRPLEARLGELRRRGVGVDGCLPLLDALAREGLL